MEDNVNSSMKGAITNNENENASKIGSQSVTSKKTKRKNNFDKVLEKARRVFNAQVVKDINTLRKTIQIVLALFEEQGYTEAKFKSEFAKRVSTILDSKLYCARCKQMSLNAYNLATHIAMLGMKKRREVLEKGFGVIQKDISEMKVPVYELTELKKYDTLGLLGDVSEKDDSRTGSIAKE